MNILLNSCVQVLMFVLPLCFPQPVGESQQVSAAGGSDVPEDPGEDPRESHEQPGNLD